VAAGDGAILVALVVLCALAARRLTAVRRQVAALRAAVDARRATAPHLPTGAAAGLAVAQSGPAAQPSAGPSSSGEGGS